MSTNLPPDPDLVQKALDPAGARATGAAVPRGPEEAAARRGRKRLLELFGTLEWDEGYDCKAARGRHDPARGGAWGEGGR